MSPGPRAALGQLSGYHKFACLSIYNHFVRGSLTVFSPETAWSRPGKYMGPWTCLGDLGSAGLATPANHIWTGRLQKRGCQSRWQPFPLSGSSASLAFSALDIQHRAGGPVAWPLAPGSNHLLHLLGDNSTWSKEMLLSSLCPGTLAPAFVQERG